MDQKAISEVSRGIIEKSVKKTVRWMFEFYNFSSIR